MRAGCGTVCFRKQFLDEAMERIPRAGYEYVEPQATAPNMVVAENCFAPLYLAVVL